jgi:hypothetical protein
MNIFENNKSKMKLPQIFGGNQKNLCAFSDRDYLLRSMGDEMDERMLQ